MTTCSSNTEGFSAFISCCVPPKHVQGNDDNRRNKKVNESPKYFILDLINFELWRCYMYIKSSFKHCWYFSVDLNYSWKYVCIDRSASLWWHLLWHLLWQSATIKTMCNWLLLSKGMWFTCEQLFSWQEPCMVHVSKKNGCRVDYAATSCTFIWYFF